MSLTRSFDEALELARERIESSLAQVTREDIFPHAAPSATGVWEGTRGGTWSSGFWKFRRTTSALSRTSPTCAYSGSPAARMAFSMSLPGA